MSGAVALAIAAAFGNLLLGWDNATLSGALLYLNKEFDFQADPTMEGLIFFMSPIASIFVTTFCGPISDLVGRRPLLIFSSFCYLLSSLIMLWSPNVYVILLARLLIGFGVGLTVTLVPLYISETAPPEKRGLLNTFPQFTGSIGMFFAYSVVFLMSLLHNLSWRVILGVAGIPSLIYLALTLFFLPESPRWLVSKGRMAETKKVLQCFHGRENVSSEMALLVEGLDVGHEITIEEYLISPEIELSKDEDPSPVLDKIKLYGPEEGLSWVARPLTGQRTAGVGSQASVQHPIFPLIDPLVTLFGSIHDRAPQSESMRSVIFPTLEWDEENVEDDYVSDYGEAAAVSDDNLQSPLISRQTTTMDKDIIAPPAHGTLWNLMQSGLIDRNAGGAEDTTGINGGWQLAWKLPSGGEKGGFKRVYLHQNGVEVTEGDEFIKASALVSHSSTSKKGLKGQSPVGPAMAHPSESANESIWSEIMEPGVKRALVVGMGIQLLQQFSGINGVLYYMPHILEQAGVGALPSNLGISSNSASFLTCAFTTLLMLPCIAVAMRLMDNCGRRSLLLRTSPILITSLVILTLAKVIQTGPILHAIISTLSIITYLCVFVMGFGPIPNILCSEIFPTRVRGICIALCSLTFWIGNILVTYSLPFILKALGFAGLFALYVVFCAIAWLFVYLKVPETKGMPLEVITEFFALGTSNTTDNNKN